MQEMKAISLALSFMVPLLWALSILFSGKIRHIAARHLFYLFVTASFMYAMVYLKFMGHVYLYTLFFPLQGLACAIIFPFFYLYVYVLTSERFVYNWKYWVHYIVPAMFLISTILVFRVFLKTDESLIVMGNILNSVQPEADGFSFAYQYYNFGKFYFILCSVAYMLLIYFRYTTFKKNAGDIFSNDSNKDLVWIKTIGFLFLLTVLFNIAIQYMRNIDISHNEGLIAVSYLVFSLFFWILGLYGYSQKNIYNVEQVDVSEGFANVPKINKDIRKYIEEEKPYLNPDISIYDLCSVFNTNRTYLSETINKTFGMNFRTLINTYRVAEAKRLLQIARASNGKISLENIAIQAGFSNYNSFLRVFKVMENISPSEYVKEK